MPRPLTYQPLSRDTDKTLPPVWRPAHYRPRLRRAGGSSLASLAWSPPGRSGDDTGCFVDREPGGQIGRIETDWIVARRNLVTEREADLAARRQWLSAARAARSPMVSASVAEPARELEGTSSSLVLLSTLSDTVQSRVCQVPGPGPARTCVQSYLAY